ncbi:NAD-dependent epimerase/dehydratase family protein [Limosilactobacillus reuteri]|uniref:NAD-dependent epimerase/dehydratase family protein n=1 Tax=Limosilactobacillus reuteri TaxID=1598 RepID=UPI000A1F5ACD|nr:NAD-dependent epimerase/dehydratase family protein [Limosilactobacillus reuteri]
MNCQIIDNKTYVAELKKYSKKLHDLNKLHNKTIMITGATGMIGSCIIDILMLQNKLNNLNCHIIAIGRNGKKARMRFHSFWNLKNFAFIQTDVNKEIQYSGKVNYIIHAASNTHPLAYATDPIGTISTNVIGTNNLLKFASQKNIDKFIFLSSVEIYGQNNGDVETFAEDYSGYIDCNTLRAGYPESKRVGEALCQAYIKQKGLNIVIPRLARVYVPTLLMTDTKALSQFIKNSLDKEDIVLKSNGNQLFSYIYSIDASTAILFCLLNGKSGEAYNVSNPLCNTTLKNLAQKLAYISQTKVKFEIPDKLEASGYSTATKALLNPNKLIKLGYQYNSTLSESLITTLKILNDVRK